MMKRLALVVAMLGGASIASAQESYSVPHTAQEVNRLDRERAVSNRKTCRKVGRPANCTQADACTGSIAVPGGASCTASQATAAGVRIYPNTLAGREEFFRADFATSRTRREDTGPQDTLEAYSDWCRNTATVAERNADCAKAGLPNGCACP